MIPRRPTQLPHTFITFDTATTVYSAGGQTFFYRQMDLEYSAGQSSRFFSRLMEMANVGSGVSVSPDLSLFSTGYAPGVGDTVVIASSGLADNVQNVWPERNKLQLDFA